MPKIVNNSGYPGRKVHKKKTIRDIVSDNTKELKKLNTTIESPKLTCVSEIKQLIKDSMKEKGISPEEAIKSIGIKRYIKNLHTT